MAQRRQRAPVYEMVLPEGTAGDVLTCIDAVLLFDLWDDLVLARHRARLGSRGWRRVSWVNSAPSWAARVEAVRRRHLASLTT
jgi:hypothetical protein